MNETTNDVLALVRSGWPQVMAIFAVIWWARKIDLREQAGRERLDRHEARLQGLERSLQDQAVILATLRESLSGIKLTLDRMYAEMREKG